jgi:flagellar biosynthesis protein FlhG
MKSFKKNIWALGGGKGGVGKSFFSVNLACCLAQMGRRVVLVDADLGGANLNVMFGIRYPEHTLGDFLEGKVDSFGEVLLATPLDNLGLICGASDILELANPSSAQKDRLMEGISGLGADHVVIDVGAGSSRDNLDFFNMAGVGIIVTSPSPTAIQNAYGFLKMAVHHRVCGVFADTPQVGAAVEAALRAPDGPKRMSELAEMLGASSTESAERLERALDEKRYRLVVNMATEAEAQKISKTLTGVAYQFLRVKLSTLGYIPHNMEVERSIRRMTPLVLSGSSAVSGPVQEIAKRAAGENGLAPGGKDADRRQKGHPPGPSEEEASSRTQLSLNDNVVHDGRTLHVQTEDLGAEKAQILTLVFAGGQILFSKSTGCGEFSPNGRPEKTVNEKVKWQHRAIMAGIRSGKLGDRTMATGGR